MGTDEEYLDSLLRAVIESEQKHTEEMPDVLENRLTEDIAVNEEMLPAGAETVLENQLQDIQEILPEPEGKIQLPETDEDPNRQLTADEIAAMFAAMDETESTQEQPQVAEEAAEDETESAQEQPQVAEETTEDETESAQEQPQVAEEATEDETESAQEQPQAAEEAAEDETEMQAQEVEDQPENTLQETFDNQDVTELLDLLGDNDSELAEINELLKKSDRNEMVSDEDEMLALLTGDTKSEETEEQSDLSDLEDTKSSKKKKAKKRKWGFKKEKTDLETIGLEDPEAEDAVNFAKVPEDANETADKDEIADKDVVSDKDEVTDKNETAYITGGADQSETTDGSELPEKDSKGKEKKIGFFGRLFQALIQEEEELEPENGAEDIKEAGTGGKKGKKKKKRKGKKTPETNEEILEELDEEDAAKAKKKKKTQKPKKEKKKKEEKRETVEKPAKKLPKKLVIRIFVLCFSLLAVILVLTMLLPGTLQLQSARKQFYQGNYEEAYQSLVGQKLSESDQILLQKAEMIVQLEQKETSYQAYYTAGAKKEALNALFEGVAYYWQHDEEYDSLGIRNEMENAYMQLIAILESEYSVSEERAKEIIAMDSIDYTYEIRSLAGEGAATVSPTDGQETENAENLAGENVMTQTEGVTEENAETPSDVMQNLEDPLEEELD